MRVEVIKMLTRQELADYLKVHVRTIDNKVKGGMPSVKFGKSVRFELNDVLEWIKEQNEKEKEK
jgi:excisionase family DNA binding protein